MGIRIVPPKFEPGTLWLKLNGIQKSDPGDYGPPNGMQVLPEIEPGLYFKISGDWRYLVRFGLTVTEVQAIFHWTGQVAYQFGRAAPYQYYGENGITSPLSRWYEGSHIISYNGNALQPTSLEGQAYTIGVGEIETTFAEPITADDASRTVRFARRKDSTCIYLRQE